VSEFTLPGAQPGAIAVADTVGAPPLTGYTTSQAVWWTDAGASRVGLARFPSGGVPGVCSCAVPLPSPAVRGAVAVSLARRITVRRGAITLTLRCVGPIRCRGRVELSSTRRSKQMLASSRFNLTAFARRTLKLRLSRAALRTIGAHKRGMTARVIIHAVGVRVPAPDVVTLVRRPG
jgi:hypothetical protein